MCSIWVTQIAKPKLYSIAYLICLQIYRKDIFMLEDFTYFDCTSLTIQLEEVDSECILFTCQNKFEH